MSVTHEGGALVLRPAGELCIATVPLLQAVLDAVPSAAAPRVIVDLEQVTLLTAAGLGVFVAARNRLERDGGALHLRNARGVVARAIHVTNLDHLLAPAGGYVLAPRPARSG